MGVMFLLVLAFVFALVALYQLFALIADFLGWAKTKISKRSNLPPVIILSVDKRGD